MDNAFIERLRALIVPWCPAGSDPGLCVATEVTPAISDWGVRCQRELATQAEALQIAAENGVFLEGLGGTNDGMIGVLAAVGLMATKNDGRVIYRGASEEDWYDVTGRLEVEEILSRGVDEVLSADDGQPITTGMINIGNLRRNYRHGRSDRLSNGASLSMGSGSRGIGKWKRGNDDFTAFRQ